ncbi:MAG TPA: PQQ-binding-like beta-propeller repeat protein [Methanocellaceae archaeon]
MRKLMLILLALVLLSVPAYAADWTQSRADAQHTSHTTDVLQPPLAVDWKINLGGTIVPSPVVWNGTLYAVVYDSGTVLALDDHTGAQKWKFKAESGTIESTPAISNGSIYVGSDDSYVYKLDASSGRMLWRSSVYNSMYSSPLAYDGKIFIGTNGGDFYALDEGTGDHVWSLSNVTQSSPAGWDGKIYVGTYGYPDPAKTLAGIPSSQSVIKHGAFYALDESTGAVVWSYDLGDDYVHSSPSIYNGTVYVAAHNGILYAFDAGTGHAKWTYDLGYETDASPSIDQATGTVFIGTFGGHVFAFDAADGSEKWISAYYGPIYASAAVSGNVLYGATQDGILFALNVMDGAELWTYKTVSSEVFVSPVVADGHLFYATTNGDVFAFSPAGVSATPSPAASAGKAAATPFIDALACVALFGVALILKRGR